jgi:hypothetical protein
MLKQHKIMFGAALASSIWAVFFVLQSDTSAYYQICETNQYTDKESCTPHHLLYVVVWYVGYVFNPTTITAFATVAIAAFTLTLRNVGRQQAIDARIVQRAYINIVSPYSQLRFDHQGTFLSLRVWVGWKNAGKTPAFPMFGRIGATFTNPGEAFIFGHPPAEIGDPMALGPGAEFTSGHIDISAVHAEAAVNGAGHLFFWGEAQYRDTFPGTPQHILEFCYKIEIDGGITQDPRVCSVRFNLYGEHNRYYDNPS